MLLHFVMLQICGDVHCIAHAIELRWPISALILISLDDK